jgi:hypothetical protein
VIFAEGELVANGLVHFKRELVVHGPAIVAHAFLWHRRDLSCQPFCGRVTARSAPAGREAHGERLVRLYRPSGEDHVEGRGADQSRQADRSAVDEWHAPAAAEDTEDRIFLGDA